VDEENPRPSRKSHFRRAFRNSLKRLEELTKTAKDPGQEASDGIEGEVKDSESQVEVHVREALAPEASTSGRRNIYASQTQTPSPSPPPEHVENGDDEEGWASDRSASPEQPDAGATTNQKKKSKAHKEKSNQRVLSHPLGAAGRRGRRTSLRRSHTLSLSQPDSAHPPVVADVRGRSSVPSAYSPHTPIPSPTRSHISSLTKSEGRQSRPGTSDSARNQRLAHIRAMHSSPPTREASPSRSVWFADEVPPSASTDLARSQPPTPPDEATTGDAPDFAEPEGILAVPRNSVMEVETGR
jgi:sodium/hydrogen antiporter